MSLGKRVFWLGLLLPQFALLLASVFHEMRVLWADLHGHAGEICGSGVEMFSPIGFALEMLGLSGVVGLCGFRAWARWLYMAFGLIVLAMGAPLVLHPPAHTPNFWPVELVVLVTMAASFSRRFGASPGLPPNYTPQPIA